MASKPSGSRRLSASKALEFLNTLVEESDEDSDTPSEDDFHSDDNYNNETSETDSMSDNDPDLDFDVNEAGPSTRPSGSRKRLHSNLTSGDSGDSEPSRSRSRLTETNASRSQPEPRSRCRPNTNTNKTRPVVSWNEIINDERVHFPAFRFAPTRTPGVSSPLTHESTPLDCFTQLFNREIKDKLRNSINDFAAKKVQMNTPARRYSVYANWEPLSDSELYKLLAVIFQMGLDPKPQIRDYWDKSDNGYSPWYSQMFDRNRFQAILHTMLHCSDVESEGKEKVEPFINSICQQFQAAFYPDQNLSLDEMVIGWNGRWKYTQFNASKPSKYHVKVFGLVDSSSGYVVNLLVYFGSETSYSVDLHRESPQAVKVFEYLLRPLSAGHHIYSDRYYTSFKLLQYLNERKMYFTGTLNLQRVGFPTELKTVKLPHMGVKWYFTEEEQILCVAFKDKKAKKPCVLVSTNSSVGTEQRRTSRNRLCEKPVPIFEYN